MHPADQPSPHPEDSVQAQNASDTILEKERRLSGSLLWELQRKYYCSTGIDAWRSGTVPSYVTNNPALARSYALVIRGFLRDGCNSGLIDLSQPFYIIELGAGSGRFAYLLLQILSEWQQLSVLPQAKLRYVMTDLAEANLVFWREHPSLQPFLERGMLDFALFDVEKDDAIHLQRAGTSLCAGDCANPPVIIANYVFDSISQDAFSIHDGQLFELLVALHCDQPNPDPTDVRLLEHMTLHYHERLADPAYYPNPIFNEILSGYIAGFADSTVLFPITAILCLERLAAVGRDRLLVLTADKGNILPGNIGEANAPLLALHGSVSLSVNYHALREYFLKRGGRVLHASSGHGSLTIAAFILNQHPCGNSETAFAFDQALEHWSPDDFFNVRRGIHPHLAEFEIPQALALIRLSGWDVRVLHDCLPSFWSCLEQTSRETRAEVAQTVLRAWKNYYHLGELPDMAFDFAMLLCSVGEYREAMRLFQQSLELYGDDPRTFWNLGLCCSALRQGEEAAAWFSRAFACSPEFRPSGALQVKSG